MEFSNSFEVSGPYRWSPDGSMVATCSGNRLFVRDTASLMIINIFSNLETVSKIEWSTDNRYILCAMYKCGTVQVWDVDHPEWLCKIREGPAGLSFSQWVPGERQILNTNEFNVRITVWSLSSGAGVVASLRSPKFAEKAMDFSRDKKFFAVAERKDCKDFIQIYRTGTWNPIHRFQVESKDLADIRWSPDDRVIGVWDTTLEYAFFAYSPEGRMLGRYQAYTDALGIKNVSWAPSSQFVAIGSYDCKTRILNQLTCACSLHMSFAISHSSASWRPIRDYEHEQEVSHKQALVYLESDLSGTIDQPTLGDHAAHAVSKSTYKLLDEINSKVRIPSVKCNPEKANPKMGIGLLNWSCDSSLLCTRADNMPNALFIWDALKLELFSVIVQLAPIKAFRWHPKECKLAVCTGGKTIYSWSRDGASCIQVPLNDFVVQEIEWSPSGHALFLSDRDAFSIAFLA